MSPEKPQNVQLELEKQQMEQQQMMKQQWMKHQMMKQQMEQQQKEEQQKDAQNDPNSSSQQKMAKEPSSLQKPIARSQPQNFPPTTPKHYQQQQTLQQVATMNNNNMRAAFQNFAPSSTQQLRAPQYSSTPHRQYTTQSLSTMNIPRSYMGGPPQSALPPHLRQNTYLLPPQSVHRQLAYLQTSSPQAPSPASMYKTPLEVWTTRYQTMKDQAKAGKLHTKGFNLFYTVIAHLNERCPGMVGWLDYSRAQKRAADAKRKADMLEKIRLAEERKKAEVLRRKKKEKDRKVAEVKAKEFVLKLEEFETARDLAAAYAIFPQLFEQDYRDKKIREEPEEFLQDTHAGPQDDFAQSTFEDIEIGDEEFNSLVDSFYADAGISIDRESPAKRRRLSPKTSIDENDFAALRLQEEAEMKIAFGFHETQILPDITPPPEVEKSTQNVPEEPDISMDDEMSESYSVEEDENISDDAGVMEETSSIQAQKEADAIMDEEMSGSYSVIENDENVPDSAELFEDTNLTQAQEEADAIMDDGISESDSIIEENENVPDTAEGMEDANSTQAQEESDAIMDDGTLFDSIEDQDLPMATSKTGEEGEVLLTGGLSAAVLPEDNIDAQIIADTSNVSPPDRSPLDLSPLDRSPPDRSPPDRSPPDSSSDASSEMAISEDEAPGPPPQKVQPKINPVKKVNVFEKPNKTSPQDNGKSKIHQGGTKGSDWSWGVARGLSGPRSTEKTVAETDSSSPSSAAAIFNKYVVPPSREMPADLPSSSATQVVPNYHVPSYSPNGASMLGGSSSVQSSSFTNRLRGNSNMQPRNGPSLFPDLSNTTPTKMMGPPTTPAYGQSPGTPYMTASPGTPFMSPTPSHPHRGGSMQSRGRGFHHRGPSRSGGQGSPTPFRTTPNTSISEHCEIEFANKDECDMAVAYWHEKFADDLAYTDLRIVESKDEKILKVSGPSGSNARGRLMNMYPGTHISVCLG